MHRVWELKGQPGHQHDCCLQKQLKTQHNNTGRQRLDSTSLQHSRNKAPSVVHGSSIPSSSSSSTINTQRQNRLNESYRRDKKQYQKRANEGSSQIMPQGDQTNIFFDDLPEILDDPLLESQLSPQICRCYMKQLAVSSRAINAAVALPVWRSSVEEHVQTICSYFVKNISMFSLQDIIGVLWGLIKLEIHDVECFNISVPVLQQLSHQGSAKDLSQCLWVYSMASRRFSLKGLHLQAPELFHRLLADYLALLPTSDSQSCSSVLMSMIRIDMMDQHHVMADIITHLLQLPNARTAQCYANAAWVIYKSNMNEPQLLQAVFKKFAGVREHSKVQDCAHVLYVCGALNYQSPKFIYYTASHFITLINRASSQDVCDALYGLSQVGYFVPLTYGLIAKGIVNNRIYIANQSSIYTILQAYHKFIHVAPRAPIESWLQSLLHHIGFLLSKLHLNKPFNPQILAHIFAMYADFNYYTQDMFDGLLSHVNHSLYRLSTDNITVILNSCARLGARGHATQLLPLHQLLMASVQPGAGGQDAMSASQLVQALWNSCVLGLVSARDRDVVAHTCTQAYTKLNMTQELAQKLLDIHAISKPFCGSCIPAHWLQHLHSTIAVDKEHYTPPPTQIKPADETIVKTQGVKLNKGSAATQRLLKQDGDDWVYVGKYDYDPDTALAQLDSITHTRVSAHVSNQAVRTVCNDLQNIVVMLLSSIQIDVDYSMVKAHVMDTCSGWHAHVTLEDPKNGVKNAFFVVGASHDDVIDTHCNGWGVIGVRAVAGSCWEAAGWGVRYVEGWTFGLGREAFRLNADLVKGMLMDLGYKFERPVKGTVSEDVEQLTVSEDTG